MPGWSKLAGGWLLAASVAIALSWGAVARVRNQVIPPPIQIPSTQTKIATATAASPDVTVIQVEAETVDGNVTSSTVGNPGFSGTSTTTTSLADTSVGTTITQAPQTTTTTAVLVEIQTSSYQLVGGVVTISYSPGVVNFVSAVPQPGFSTDQSEAGPDRVRVRFESETHTSDFRAEWKGDELEITKNESGEGD